MGLFKTNEEKEQERINQFITDLKSHSCITEEAIRILLTLFENDTEYTKTIVNTFDKYSHAVDCYLDYIKDITRLINDKDLILSLLNSLLATGKLCFPQAITLLNCFADKEIVVSIFNTLKNNDFLLEETSPESMRMLTDYIVEVRQYYVDERACLSSFITLIKNIDPTVLKYGESNKIKKEIAKK